MIVRAQRKDHFTVINNIAISDERLGFRAKGVLIFILSKPDNWSVSERGLAQVGPDGRDAVAAALKELEACGYLRRTKTRNPDGTWAWDSMVFDVPQTDGELPASAPEAVAAEVNGVADFPPEDDTMAGFSSHGLTVHGKPSQIIKTEQINTDLLSPSRAAPGRAAEKAAATTGNGNGTVKRSGSPYMRGLVLPGGYVPAGQGANAVQVYYERFHFSDPDAHLSMPQEDDLIRLCPDLDRLREVVVAYSRTGFKRGNINLILDWYRDGVPARQANTNGGSNGNGKTTEKFSVAGGRAPADSGATDDYYTRIYGTEDEYQQFQRAIAFAKAGGHD